MASGAFSVSPVANSKDSASKRKRTNRLAKLKQCKLEARRGQWLSQKDHPHVKGTSDADLHPCVGDPGEVIHPDRAELKPLLPLKSTISWASLVISSQMPKYSQRTQPNTELFTSARETDPVPLDVNPNAANLRIKRSDQKISHRDARAGPVCDGCEDADGSPKSCEDRSPKSDNSGLVEDGWEAASDALGLHTIEKKFSNVLQPQSAVSNDHRQRPRASNASLLGPKPSSQQQNASHGRAWMQGDLHRPTSLPNPMKQRNSGTQLSSIRHTNDGTERLECLICTEVLDSTDASFDSCECGFNICLFCYHKISQETGRCPGCRGIYKQDVSAKPVCLLPR